MQRYQLITKLDEICKRPKEGFRLDETEREKIVDVLRKLDIGMFGLDVEEMHELIVDPKQEPLVDLPDFFFNLTSFSK